MIYKLNDIITRSNTGLDAIRRAPIVERETGIKCIRITDISQKKSFDDWGNTEVLESDFDKFQLKKEDILIARTGATIGVNRIINEDLKAVYNNGLIRIQINKKIANPRFVYYSLNTNEYWGRINAVSSGTVAQPNMKMKDLLDYELNIPSIDIQNKIVKVLKNIDDRIELNNEINDNLCEQIKATYKRIIDGSNNLKVTRIGDLPIYVTDYVANGSFASLKENVTLYQEPNYAYFIRNTDLKSGNFDVYVDEHSYNFLSKSTLKGKEIIISNVGDVGSVFLCPKLNKPMTLGNNVIMIEPEDEKLRYYLYSLFKWFDGYNLIQGIKGGSAVPKFNKTDFKNIKINLPLEKELEEFNNFVSPYFEKIIQNKDANKRLSELRDSLLPKLMSGEIDVDSIEL